MTLVIGHTLPGGELQILSDTRIYDERRQAADAPWQAIQKLILPTPHLAIAFSGSVELAQQALLDLAPGQFRASKIARVLARHSAVLSGRVDFVLAGPTGRPLLVNQDGVAERDVVWTGNQAAFSAFQQCRAHPEEFPISPGAHTMMTIDLSSRPNPYYQALHRLLEARSFDDVGDFVVTGMRTGGVFRFGNRVERRAEYCDISSLGDDWTVMPLGNESDGSFQVTFLDGLYIDKARENRVLGLHFEHGEFGYVYLAEGFAIPVPTVVHGSCSEFVQAARNDYEVRFVGFWSIGGNKVFVEPE